MLPHRSYPIILPGCACLWLLIASYFAIPLPAKAQDAVFAQQELAPLLMNPALAGSEYMVRGSAAYRSQTFGAAIPFKTAYAGFDMLVSGSKDKTTPAGRLGIGVYFLNDRAGDPTLRTTQAMFSTAYNISLSNKSTLGAGFSLGFDQHRLDPASGKWGSQYNGIAFDPGKPSGESYAGDSQSHMDIGAGIIYGFRSIQKKRSTAKEYSAQAGLSVFHAGRVVLNKGDYFSYAVAQRYTAFAKGNIPFGSGYTSIQPALWAHVQDKYYQVMLGSMARYTIDDASAFMSSGEPSAISAGIFLRTGDAMIVRALFEWSNYAIGAAFEIPVYGSGEITPKRGAAEISIAWRKN